MLGLAFSGLAISSARHAAAAIIGVLFEAAFYGGFMWLFIGGRLRNDINSARQVPAWRRRRGVNPYRLARLGG